MNLKGLKWPHDETPGTDTQAEPQRASPRFTTDILSHKSCPVKLISALR